MCQKPLSKRFPVGCAVEAFSLRYLSMKPAIVKRFLFDRPNCPYAVSVQFLDSDEEITFYSAYISPQEENAIVRRI